ncbi:prolipoprotein diacylglyceryl transferase [Alteraurantiacibacter aquimixticola]|uniref:Phosphatidylglycerol--prolipoprotein diacylglyceryl transferase n=1 Tax=Alteraurantiacibacter aquimixticola TaxID=2489173 RepID=A0A4T3EZD0_9SPHN|nr:prolipoprotein diacylglyceryl transferase [Alteraurantiacibacter aquimixticola]TIX48904.1 prolipoprotein diacylglyceryl transferase [Alteraurantiacibacter aquimixticola]
MLDFLAASGANVINWADLGLKEGIDLGFFTLRYYSLAYLAGLIVGYWHLRKMLDAPGAPMAKRHADDLFFYCMIGIIVGGRLGYVVFYRPDMLGTWEMFNTLGGGMSFHGGLIGTVLAIAFVSWRGGLSFIRVCDYIAVNVGFGMFFGRIANFINGELWGRPVESAVPWAMRFPGAGPEPRHPSQLYEAGLEGLLVVVVMLALFWLTRARYRPALLVGVFTAVISAGRFVVEFFREPDAHLSEFAAQSGLNMGQWLTIPLILLGLGLVAWALSRPPLSSGYVPSGEAKEPETA